MPHPSKYLILTGTATIKLLTRQLQNHQYFTLIPLIYLDPKKNATTSGATQNESTNTLLLSTASIPVPSIYPPKSVDTTSASPTTYLYHVLHPIFAPNTPASVFPPYITTRLPI